MVTLRSSTSPKKQTTPPEPSVQKVRSPRLAEPKGRICQRCDHKPFLKECSIHSAAATKAAKLAEKKAKLAEKNRNTAAKELAAKTQVTRQRDSTPSDELRPPPPIITTPVRRCSQCDGCPPLNQCEHTGEGLRYLHMQAMSKVPLYHSRLLRFPIDFIT